jgi:hypothetical protein
MCDFLHASHRATSSHLRARASYGMLFTLDKFPSVCRMKPNAKSVSERIWQRSHEVKSNPAHASDTMVSQALALQEVVRYSQG